MSHEELINILNHINEINASDEYRTEKLLPISKLIYELEINDVRTFETDTYIIYKHYVLLSNHEQRSYLVKIPKQYSIQNIKKCILFFHGSRDLHWDCALLSTKMLSDKFITVYLQGNNQGVYQLEEPHIHTIDNKSFGITYGENYFEIRDFAANFNDDLEYVKLVKQDLSQLYSLTDFYAVGHSNGGVFVCLFPVYLPNEFKAIVSHQGGMGWDQYFNIPFEKLDLNATKPFMYFHTGSEDIHKLPCIQAHQIFSNEEFDSKLYIEEGLGHCWRKYHEEDILHFLSQY